MRAAYQVSIGEGILLSLTASLLQLRGAEPVQPPLQDALGNVLLFNGAHCAEHHEKTVVTYALC